ncbi:hypothetical protein HA402_002352 [Bradysia odoriphaga]|nr:hypothetical protein HA402_002352 [Bradysia odoriphaga]
MAISNRLTLILVVFCAVSVIADFGFPENEEDDASKKNAQNKKPVFLPQQCNENELFYPGDQKDDWVCDCKPGHIYHPKTDRCYSPYRQGPCPANQFLMIPPGQYIPECLTNRCTPDGWVTFKNKCYLLNEAGPCDLAELSYVVAVNTTSLELECIKQNPDIFPRFGEEEMFGTTCLRGSKRSIQGKCEK